LLDWTEGALIALFFALMKMPNHYCVDSKKAKERYPVVWRLMPSVLCCLTTQKWSQALENKTVKYYVQAAWGCGTREVRLPMPMYPAYVDARLAAQQGAFTVHGSKDVCLHKLVEEDEKKNLAALCLKRFYVSSDKDCVDSMLQDLRTLGISHTTLFPDLDHLGWDIETRMVQPLA
jgi:hypothetical protein